MNYQIRERPNKAGETRYSVVLEVWADGGRKVVPGGTHDTRQLAINAGEKLLMQYEDDAERLKALRGNLTLREWFAEWSVGLSMKSSTINSYLWRMEHWVLPHLGDVQLKSLTMPVLDRWINGDPLARLSKGSKQAALDALRGCLKKAVRLGMLAQDPTQGLTLDMTRAQKKEEKGRKKVKTWTYEEVTALLEASVGEAIESLVVLGLLAGERPGEARIARWSDLDFLDGRVLVSRTIVRGENARLEISDSTKTGEDRRARLTSDAAFRLMRMKEVREAQGSFDPDAPIYPDQHVSASTPGKQLKRLCKKAGVKVLPPHSLRHTHASLLLENGATLAAVAKQLGHDNPVTTGKTYWHVVDDTADTISGVMDRALQKKPVEPVEIVQDEVA